MKQLERLKFISALASVAASILAILSLASFFDSSLPLFNLIDGSLEFTWFIGFATFLSFGAASIMLIAARTKKLRERYQRVFIVYSKEDLDIAQRIAQLLRENDLEPWLDVDEITAGQIWMDEIENALERSAIAIVLVSKNLVNSSFADKEMKIAISKLETDDRTSSPLIPVLLDESEMPSRIAHIQYVDFKKKDAESYLVKSLNVAMTRALSESSR